MLRRAALLLTLAPAVVACQGSGRVLAEVSEPHEFEIVFRNAPELRGGVSFHAIVTLENGRELWLFLDGLNGEPTSMASHRWAKEFNHRSERCAEATPRSLILHRVTRIELRGPLMGLRVEDRGPSR